MLTTYDRSHPSEAFKVALLLTAVVDVRVRVAAEPSEPVRPVFIVRIAFLATPALRKFSRDPFDRPLGAFTTLPGTVAAAHVGPGCQPTWSPWRTAS